MNNTVLITTLGCKVNQYDSGALIEMFRAEGFEPFTGGVPDVVIVNTCVVTAESERKSRQAIRRMRGRYPGALLAVIGCYPQLQSGKAADAMGADFVAGTSGHGGLVAEIMSKLRSGETRDVIQQAQTQFTYGRERERSVADRVRAYIKIQEGCDNFCSYCIVPYVRGRARSRGLPDILREVYRAVSAGSPEIILTGTHISSYKYNSADDKSNIGENGYINSFVKNASINCADFGLGGLINIVSDCIRRPDAQARRLASDTEPTGPETPPGSPTQTRPYVVPVRLRLSSLEPTVVTPEFVRCLAENRDVLRPHFHLSLQSGCASVLRRMNRKYSPREYRDAVALLRDAFPDAGVTTDVITGFPGESEDDFAETMEFCREIAFSKIHVFPYSPRPGTRAAELAEKADQKGQIDRADQIIEADQAGQMDRADRVDQKGRIAWADPAARRERAGRLIALSDRSSLAFISRYIGAEVEILVERASNGAFEGLTGNYIRVKVVADKSPLAAYDDDTFSRKHDPLTRDNVSPAVGSYATVRVTGATPTHAIGVLTR